MSAVLLLLLTGCKGGRVYPHDRGLVGQLESELIALKMANNRLEDDLQSCGEGTPRSDTYPQLVQVFTGTDVAIRQEGSHIVLTLPVDFVYADPITLRMRVEADQAIDLVATALELNPTHPVEVHGHTDDALLPPEAAKLHRTPIDLTYHQAAALAERLDREHPIDGQRFAVVAHGPNAPIAPNATEGGQRANRRIEIHLLPPPPTRP